MADIIENEEADKDTVDSETLDKLFHKSYQLLTETSVSLKKSYINRICINKSQNIAVTLSNNSIEVYELGSSSLNKVCRLSGHQKSVTEVVFNPKEDHLVYSSGLDGVVKLWDTRASGSCVQEYKDVEDNITKPLSCADVSASGRVLCAGSELVQDDAFLVFWDTRAGGEPLGGYWNSHTDDVTQVKFHPEKSEVLATGSLDNLLNIFNITETTEDDALQYSLQTGNSVERLSWLEGEVIACLTQSNDLQLWGSESGDCVASFQRDKIAKSIKRSRGDDCYLVDVIGAGDGQNVLLAGSHAGDGECLRSVTIAGKKLQPRTNFTQNKQVVSCCRYDKERDILITAGESGVISVWKAGAAAAPSNVATKLANKVHKLSVNRHKPY